MSTLKQKSQAILNEKTSKIIPENIKNGVTIFDVVGTYESSVPIYTEDTTNNVIINTALVGQKYDGVGAFEGLSFYMLCLSSKFGNGNDYTVSNLEYGIYNATNNNFSTTPCDVKLYDSENNLLLTLGGLFFVNAQSYMLGGTTFQGDSVCRQAVRFEVVPSN